MAATIDVLPTFAKLAGADLPKLPIDGKDISPLMLGAEGAKTPHDAYYYYWARHLHAVRSGPWKLHFPHEYRTLDGKPGGTGGKPAQYVQKQIGLSLFNLEKDIGETTDVSAEHADVVERLKKLADQMREELGDTATKQQGKGVRPAGTI
jgi:arylsulfatase A